MREECKTALGHQGWHYLNVWSSQKLYEVFTLQKSEKQTREARSAPCVVLWWWLGLSGAHTDRDAGWLAGVQACDDQQEA
jgi:hypothetical protein